MTDTPVHGEHQPDLAGLRDRFPGFFPPDEVQVKDFITTGMVAFDTNALLDVYRLNPQAREEYLAALRKLGNRLFVPHRVGQELLEHRLTVIKECSTATAGFGTDLSKTFDTVTQHIRSFGNRRGLSEEQRAELERLATEARDAITAKAGEFYDFGMELDTSLKGDPIIAELVRLLDGKVGPAVADFPAAEAEAKRRIENRIPPGFMDAKKDPDRAIGDYLIWRQILDRTAEAKKPVVLVTNDQKPDWAREDQGKKLGAHPDLVAEMMRKCGLPFHLVSVQTFLVHAREHLGATVSDATVTQAETIDPLFDAGDWLPDLDYYAGHKGSSSTVRYTEAEITLAKRLVSQMVGSDPFDDYLAVSLTRILEDQRSALQKARLTPEEALANWEIIKNHVSIERRSPDAPDQDQSQ